MRIVIDMQGAQTESRYRGIGRHSVNLSKAIIENQGPHEIFLALNSSYPDAIESIRFEFRHFLPKENIRIWNAPGPLSYLKSRESNIRHICKITREAFLSSLKPDLIHVASLFEGYADDAITSINEYDLTTPVSVTLYDLIPMLNPQEFFSNNSAYESFYHEKLADLKKASLFCGISDSSLSDLRNQISLKEKRLLNVSAAVSKIFSPKKLKENEIQSLRSKFGLKRDFIMYTGGADQHKNLLRLIESFAGLDQNLRDKYHLLLCGKIPQGEKENIISHGRKNELHSDQLIFSGYIEDNDLINLYRACTLFVYPSWHEGFGLPVLEAMSCGAPVICGNRSSLPEVIGRNEAMFDPLSTESIKEKIRQLLLNEVLREKNRRDGLQLSRKFSWNSAGKKAIQGFEELTAFHRITYRRGYSYPYCENLINQIAQQAKDEKINLVDVSSKIAANLSSGIERQLLVDVSELCQRDSATGVQRVVRSYLQQLLAAPPKDFVVRPVYASLENGYRYANKFTHELLRNDCPIQQDSLITFQRGDVFFGLDMQHHVQLRHQELFFAMQAAGVTVKFMVYDLLPIQFPNLFADSKANELHKELMRLIVNLDEAICISKATAEALMRWVKSEKVSSAKNFKVSWLHMGSDFLKTGPSTEDPGVIQECLKKIAQRPSFLWVSTIEPRKGQDLLLDAFEELWKAGHEFNLLFVGQQGWKVDELAQRINNHAESNKRLFWLQGISDEFLEKVYACCTCLIAASLNEGFGLPLIE
ncbi:MAG: glycosyltransferase family 1 protein, partial [Alphaproteobacteria bacterium]|nr:glycosyltransferase family 1 protein [Alphaproteobacteria bacterium]